jgi:hypothetical protein
MELPHEQNEIVRRQVERHSGFEVKAQRRWFMLAFASSRDAMRRAIGIQWALADRISGVPQLRVRIRPHTGEATQEADDFFGKAVVLAGRIAADAVALRSRSRPGLP